MIKLNDLLRLEELENVKIRFNLMFDGVWDPVSFYKKGDIKTLLDGHYYNKKGQKSYKEGLLTIGFIKIEGNKWLLFHIGKVTKDLDVLGGVGYEYESIPEYEKYCGRLIVDFKNTVQQTVRWAETVIDDITVSEILADNFDNDTFPGYENVRLSWSEMSYILDKKEWSTALRNQKGIYLITDKSNGSKYVGSASGKEMLLGRWKDYIKSGHGGNKGLKVIPFDHIKENFEYSILEIFKSTTSDDKVLARETWWKETLLSRQFGYNKN